MRVTHQMLSRNYIKRMNTNLNNLTHSNEKLSSQRKFNKGYENVSDAGKALRLRKLTVDNTRYQTTIRDVKGRAEAAEDNIRTVNSLMIRTEELVVQGLNGTMSESDRDKIAIELEKMQEEVLQVMNNTYNGNHIFAAAGSDAPGKAPFAVVGGQLTYNGTPVDEMAKVNGVITHGGNEIQFNTPNYVDIGFGYKDKNGYVDPDTAFKDTYSGVECFGYGKNEDDIPINAWSLLGDMVNSLRGGNLDRLGQDLDAISGSMEFMLTSITEIGARTVTLDNTAARLENEYENLADALKNVESIDVAEEIIYNKDYEMSWLITLQLGSKILPQTIFDFIR
ncbi:hypothetical protein LJC49_01520 [Ruminococcaceae bacterium OttesenSCG-928-I18]|nr:hypothetical protein [Ruminococcaceae bacterium OttesenSCG-928-I18]